MSFIKNRPNVQKTGYAAKQKTKIRLVILGIFIFVILAGSLVYPNVWDRTINWINSNAHLGLPTFHKLPFKLGLDLQGGTHLIYSVDLSNINEDDRDNSLNGIRDVIERRVNMFGVSEAIVQVNKAEDAYRLIVDLPGVKDVHEAIKMIGETPYLEFKTERTTEETNIILEKQKAGDQTALATDAYFESTQLTGRFLKNSQLSFDQTTYQPYVLLEFNDEGAKIFAELTKNNIGKTVAIYLDGAPISIPRVNEEIPSGKAQISGNFTQKEAKQLAERLNAGALPVPIILIGQQSIEASLGQDSLRQSLKAGIIGFLIILLFMIVFYRLSGFFAGLSLVIYIIGLLAIFKLIPVTLTLSGIAGFLLSMGMAVDANILIFSRTREELKSGRYFADALNNGIKRAWPSIRDGNFTTILVGVVLFLFGTGFVKGFALTLVLGNIISMFSAIVITNYLIKFFLGLRETKKKIWL
ncbi:MAG TPA: protein translocase subunit SecD [Candidatus Portnoybacteria bacterium]|jgi:preprotein translocase subunit SecD|nr:protein translocase subunit SecD [Candidatus Portnoybacteria bacterium]MDD5752055.1 protein translocase subunit SecD [Candidatus Portnoybacteria bacterium]HOZ16405.1 protein translocase subunit SecD [Candidatus Portnoybacteria bacterium]HPH52045.1 protein translocase subunit SecD [Candidatus Portnoybacteria bacterium]HPM28436.1 protein translocase subunit SecD [Candidatus Portnoybacteria bacterium]